MDDSGLFPEEINTQDVHFENRSRKMADGARFIHWVGIALLGTFLVNLLNGIPPRFSDPSWQLNLLTLLISNGGVALLGTLLVCLARLFNLNDPQIQTRTLLVRKLATWVALGWLLLIPLQLFLGVRIVNDQAGREIEQIQLSKRVSAEVKKATTEDQVRKAVSQLPNTTPLPRFTVPLAEAKANLLEQIDRNTNVLTTRHLQISSNRWQTFIKEAIRNCLQCVLLWLGFFAIGKRRAFAGDFDVGQI
jgi:cytochrome b561